MENRKNVSSLLVVCTML